MSRAPEPTVRGAEPPPAIASPRHEVLRGDALDVLSTLPSGSVQTTITSPPYWGLRDYGVPPRVWGGEAGCTHRWGPADRGPGGGRSCRRCGAWKGCLGLEPDPDLYVEHLVSVLAEVRRVLRPDGTLWLVLGDSFAPRSSGGLKPKDLVGVPWRVAFALQAEGWWLRSEIVWEKPNAMPESVVDRPTRSHEQVFLLSPSSRYHYDAFAVREPDKGGRSGNGYARPERLSYRERSGTPRGQAEAWVGGGGRNRRSVWEIATGCFKGAHFATFPEELVEVCLLAGTSPVACRSCGAPWRRVVSSRRLLDGRHEIKGGWTEKERHGETGRSPLPTGYGQRRVRIERETVGWRAGCDHQEPGGRCTVLDPFAGSGTTGIVAARHGRDFLGVELSSGYARMARGRLRRVAGDVREGRR